MTSVIQYIRRDKFGTFYHSDPAMTILHREDGPAEECVNGNKFWHRNGKLHREDGPAAEYVNGDKFWHRNGMFHRKDGPAGEYTDGRKIWYLNGVGMTETEFNKASEVLNIRVVVNGVTYKLVKA